MRNSYDKKNDYIYSYTNDYALIRVHVADITMWPSRLGCWLSDVHDSSLNLINGILLTIGS